MHFGSQSLRGRTIDGLLVRRVWVARIEAGGTRLCLAVSPQPTQRGNRDYFSLLYEQPTWELLSVLLREAQRSSRIGTERRASLFEQRRFGLSRVR